ncbi:MAG: hypothetical protein AB7V18_19410 [Pyrinomonadaceae bacterium]
MAFDFEPLIDEILDDLKHTGDGLWERILVERRPVVERAVRRIAELTAKKLTDPQNIPVYEQDLQHNYNTLLSEAAFAQALAEQEFWDFVGRLINRLTSFALSLVP